MRPSSRLFVDLLDGHCDGQILPVNVTFVKSLGVKEP